MCIIWPDTMLVDVRRKFPEWKIWRGTTTGELWAAPPPGHPRQNLINAPTPEEMEARLTTAESLRD